MTSKPWDTLRAPAPIKTGHTHLANMVGVKIVTAGNRNIHLGLGQTYEAISTQDFNKQALLDLSELCQELAKQIV